MRQVDPTLELVACGSSKPTMPTFAEWERVVLSHTYEHVDYISCHAYYEELDGDLKSFLASGANMDEFIVSLIATIDHVKAALKSKRTINISFDEWNVWYNKRWHTEDKPKNATEWRVAPRLLEDQYSVADAVVFGSLLISLLRHADRVTSASLAQLVNVIAPIMTEPNGPAWRQTIFYPFAEASRLAAGVVLRLNLTSDTYDTDMYGSVNRVDAIATHDAETGAVAVFLVNRGVDEEAEVTLHLGPLLEGKTVSASTIADGDVYAANSLEEPERVVPQVNERVTVQGGLVTIVLPAVSWTTLTIS
jgi:alpha-N-arabinofuranosidase